MQEKIKIAFKRSWLLLAGVIVGSLVGYFYWRQIGCVSGTCGITSSPLNSTLYGALMGGLFANLFRKEKIQ